MEHMKLEINNDKITLDGKTYALVEKQGPEVEPIDHELEEARKKYEGKRLKQCGYDLYAHCIKVSRGWKNELVFFNQDDGVGVLNDHELAPFQPPVWKCCHTEPPEHGRDVLIASRNSFYVGYQTNHWSLGNWSRSFKCLTDETFKAKHPTAVWCELPGGEG